MRIFVINLKKDVERKKKIETQLKALALDYEIIEAIYGKDLKDEELETLVKDYKNSYLTKGEIGCVLSHQLIYKKMQEENIHHALILEDDAVIKPEVKEFLEEMDEFLANKKDFLLLLYKARIFYKNKNFSMKSRRKIYEAHNPNLTHAYIITKNSAKTMLRINSPIILEADKWISFKFLSSLKVYSLNENIITTYGSIDNSDSNIETQRLINHDKREFYIKKLLKRNFKFWLNKNFFKAIKKPFFINYYVDKNF